MKYGIVYLWYDRKHKRFYLGCHWGTEDDGYICSSSWMKKAYKRRPQDFKRRILKRVYDSREALLEEEYKWLKNIKPEELGTRYYNVENRKFNHWSASDLEQIKKTVSIKTKEAMSRPDVRERYLEGLKTRNNRSDEPEVIEKRRKSMIETMAKKFPNRKIRPKFGSEEYKSNMVKSCKIAWTMKSEKQKENRAKKISESLRNSKESRSKMMSQMIWWNNGIKNTRSIQSPGIGWEKGRLCQ
jgi:phage pi2 protein 07